MRKFVIEVSVGIGILFFCLPPSLLAAGIEEEINSKIELLGKSIDKKLSELQSLQTQNSLLQKGKEDLLTQLNDKEKVIKELQEKLTACSLEKKNTLLRYKKEIEELLNKLQEKEGEIENLRSDLLQLEKIHQFSSSKKEKEEGAKLNPKIEDPDLAKLYKRLKDVQESLKLRQENFLKRLKDTERDISSVKEILNNTIQDYQ